MSVTRRNILHVMGGAVVGFLGRLWRGPGSPDAVIQGAGGVEMPSSVVRWPLIANLPGTRTTYTYSAMGQIQSAINPDGSVTLFDRLRHKQVTDASANARREPTHDAQEASEVHPSADKREGPCSQGLPEPVRATADHSIKSRQIEPILRDAKARTVAFGPVMPGWGSWQWIGDDIRQELAAHFQTISFDAKEIPQPDVTVFMKFAPPLEVVEAVARRSAIIYVPVDYYGSPAEIDADAKMLRTCPRILIHCERLRKYFEPYAPVEYMDHHVKFAVPMTEGGQEPFVRSTLRAVPAKGSCPEWHCRLV